MNFGRPPNLTKKFWRVTIKADFTYHYLWLLLVCFEVLSEVSLLYSEIQECMPGYCIESFGPESLIIGPIGPIRDITGNTHMKNLTYTGCIIAIVLEQLWPWLPFFSHLFPATCISIRFCCINFHNLFHNAKIQSKYWLPNNKFFLNLYCSDTPTVRIGYIFIIILLIKTSKVFYEVSIIFEN